MKKNNLKKQPKSKPKQNLKKKVTQKRAQDKAEITALLTQNRSFSLQRLMHDYNEIKNQAIPLPGVSAVPLDSDFYEWHGNIKALSGNGIYKGAVLHFKLQFPKRYPIDPPTIYLLNTGFYHPNVLPPENRICVDILKNPRNQMKAGNRYIQSEQFFFNSKTSSSTMMKRL